MPQHGGNKGRQRNSKHGAGCHSPTHAGPDSRESRGDPRPAQSGYGASVGDHGNAPEDCETTCSE